MNLEQLKYVIEIAKQRSITHAADKLHVSPPSISKSISNLENELGIVLFSRSKKGMIPTQQGKAIIKKVFEVMTKLDELKEEAKFQETLTKNKLKVLCAPSMSYPAYYSLLKIREKFPDVIIEIQEKPPNDVLKETKLGECDIGLLPIRPELLDNELDIVYEVLSMGGAYIWVGRQSHLYSLEFVTLEDFKNERLVMHNGEHTSRSKDLYFPSNEVVFSSNNIGILRKAVKEGIGISINSFGFFLKNETDVLNGDIKIIPIKNLPTATPYGYIRLFNKPFSEPANSFLDCLKTYFINGTL
ncbi:LysR family transcriptional regulator [Bacillus sp. JJ722]|uniref:LysR family transcriptional regulator n=1 Tax=Bacillus sp. JJ722 TaxID=3122973 RepID=UPI002FFE13A3